MIYDAQCQPLIYWLRPCFLFNWVDLRAEAAQPVAWQAPTPINHYLAGGHSWFGLLCWHISAWGRAKKLLCSCMCACMCVRCSNCVGAALLAECSAMWVMRCFSIGSDVQPPTWRECLQHSWSPLPPHYLEPAESSHSTGAFCHLSHLYLLVHQYLLLPTNLLF